MILPTVANFGIVTTSLRIILPAVPSGADSDSSYRSRSLLGIILRSVNCLASSRLDIISSASSLSRWSIQAANSWFDSDWNNSVQIWLSMYVMASGFMCPFKATKISFLSVGDNCCSISAVSAGYNFSTNFSIGSVVFAAIYCFASATAWLTSSSFGV